MAPTDSVPCIRLVQGKRVLSPLRWGLLPFWAKRRSDGARMINARAESLLDKPFFKEASFERRCLVVSDGCYEWLRVGKGKQPYLLAFDDGHVFAYAGLWSRWRDKETSEVVESCTILTTPPNDIARRVHDRMPLIFDPKVDKDRIAAWLDVSTSIDVMALRHPRALEGLVAFPVSKRVGNVRNDDAAVAVSIDLT